MAQNYDIECFRIVGLLHVNRIKVKPDDLTIHNQHYRASGTHIAISKYNLC